MIVFEKAKSVISQILLLLRRVSMVLVGFPVIGLGALLGYMLSSPETAELAISILVILVVMLIIVNNPLNGVLVWVMLLPFIDTWIEIPLGSGIPDLSFSRLSIAFLAIFMLARAAIGKMRFFRLNLADVCIIATTLGIMISAPLADDPINVIQHIAIDMQFSTLVIYFFARNLVQNKDDLHKLLATIVVFGFVAASYAIYEQATGNILFLQKGDSAARLWTSYTDSLRLIRGLLERSGNFARVLTSSIPISFYLFFESKTITRKILLVGMLLIQTYGMFLTYNRTSWYALLITLSILLFFYPQFRKVYLLIIFVAAIALWATWDQVSESAVVEERVNSDVSTMDDREIRWQAGYNMWRAKPIRGWGFGRYEHESGNFRPDEEPWNLKAIENEYLDILVGSGLIGFLPFLFFLLSPLIKSVRLFFRSRAPGWTGFIKPETIAIYWVVIIAFAIGSYTQIQTQAVVKLIPFALAGAVVGSHDYLLRIEKENERSAAKALLTASGSSE